MAKPTKRNHVIPCFWSALWNEDYFYNFISGAAKQAGKRNSCREQKVFSLEYKANKILHKKVDDVFYIRNLGITLVTKSELAGLNNILNQETGEIFTGKQHDTSTHHLIDIENFFTISEDNYGYKEALDTIRTNKIEDIIRKTYIACFIAINLIRGLRFFNALFEKYLDHENPKFETLKHFRAVLSSTNQIYSLIVPWVNSKWTLYSLKEFTLPLGDTPVLFNGKFIWIILSPKHLIEIDISIQGRDKIKYRDTLNEKKYIQIRTQIVRESYNAIIFPNRTLLEKLKSTVTWKMRKRTVGPLDFSNFYV